MCSMFGRLNKDGVLLYTDGTEDPARYKHLKPEALENIYDATLGENHMLLTLDSKALLAAYIDVQCGAFKNSTLGDHVSALMLLAFGRYNVPIDTPVEKILPYTISSPSSIYLILEQEEKLP